MVELVDTLVLGTSAVRREGSSPLIRTKNELFGKFERIQRSFSLVLRSKNQMFSGGRKRFRACGARFFVLQSPLAV